MRYLSLVLCLPLVAKAAVPTPATTPFTRGFLRTTNATEAATYIGAGGDVTNTYNTIITTNLTVLSTLTVSNITVTNVTIQNNLTVSNHFVINGKNNTL